MDDSIKKPMDNMLGIMYHVKKTALQYKNIEMANSYVQNLRIKKNIFEISQTRN